MKEQTNKDSEMQRYAYYEIPKVEVTIIAVENGYAASVALGGNGNNVSTEGEYSWKDEIDL